jgi:hypothetical protein
MRTNEPSAFVAIGTTDATIESDAMTAKLAEWIELVKRPSESVAITGQSPQQPLPEVPIDVKKPDGDTPPTAPIEVPAKPETKAEVVFSSNVINGEEDYDDDFDDDTEEARKARRKSTVTEAN